MEHSAGDNSSAPGAAMLTTLADGAVLAMTPGGSAISWADGEALILQNQN